MEEVWKDIPGYEGRYQASTLGNIKSLPRYVSNHTGMLLVKEKLIKQRKNKKGYMICYNPDLFQKEQEEYRSFLKSLEPRLDFCLKYDQISLLPPLSIKIKEVIS